MHVALEIRATCLDLNSEILSSRILTGVTSGVKVLETSYFEKKIGAIIPFHYMKNGNHIPCH